MLESHATPRLGGPPNLGHLHSSPQPDLNPFTAAVLTASVADSKPRDAWQGGPGPCLPRCICPSWLVALLAHRCQAHVTGSSRTLSFLSFSPDLRNPGFRKILLHVGCVCVWGGEQGEECEWSGIKEMTISQYHPAGTVCRMNE